MKYTIIITENFMLLRFGIFHVLLRFRRETNKHFIYSTWIARIRPDRPDPRTDSLPTDATLLIGPRGSAVGSVPSVRVDRKRSVGYRSADTDVVGPTLPFEHAR